MLDITPLKKLISFYRLNNPFETHDNDYWRLRQINVFLVLITFIYAFFIVFNLFVTHLYINVVIETIGLLAVFFIIFNYHRKGQVQETSHYIVMCVFIITAALIFVAGKGYGILFWSIFLPIFAMMLTGQRQGLYYSITYYAILFIHLFANLGQGDISAHALIEFVIISAALVAIMYYYEASRIQAYRQLQDQALHDPLTGLYNRRFFDKTFFNEFARLRRSRAPFAFFMMDLDQFKEYNDSYGHLEGDLALKSIANILNAYLRRPGDACFRLGGEEFGGITNCVDIDACVKYVEHIRMAIEGLEITHEANTERGILTASFGLVIVSKYDVITDEDVYRAADEALYKAKANGKNRTEVTFV